MTQTETTDDVQPPEEIKGFDVRWDADARVWVATSTANPRVVLSSDDFEALKTQAEIAVRILILDQVNRESSPRSTRWDGDG